MSDAIIKQGTRILTPDEYRMFSKELNPTYAVICDVLLHTGLRVEEFWEFVEHPRWYKASKHCISLPKEAIHKKENQKLRPERDVLLSDLGCAAVETLLGMKNIHKVTRHAMNEALKLASVKAGFDPLGFTPKMFRKMCASYLMKIYPEKEMYISVSMGHSRAILQKHYLGMVFEKPDIKDMRVLFDGWA
jgi:integrase